MFGKGFGKRGKGQMTNREKRLTRRVARILYELSTEGPGGKDDFEKEDSEFKRDLELIAEDAALAALRSSWGEAYQTQRAFSPSSKGDSK